MDRQTWCHVKQFGICLSIDIKKEEVKEKKGKKKKPAKTVLSSLCHNNLT